jgi:diadenosine tetraphosphate (Ap4A) HIT family hydrolase
MVEGFFRAVGQTARQLGLEEGGYRLIANTGDNAHQELPHLHFHILSGKKLGPMLSR